MRKNKIIYLILSIIIVISSIIPRLSSNATEIENESYIYIHKEDSNGSGMKNICFQLFSDEECTKPLGFYITNSEGNAEKLRNIENQPIEDGSIQLPPETTVYLLEMGIKSADNPNEFVLPTDSEGLEIDDEYADSDNIPVINNSTYTLKNGYIKKWVLTTKDCNSYKSEKYYLQNTHEPVKPDGTITLISPYQSGYAYTFITYYYDSIQNRLSFKNITGHKASSYTYDAAAIENYYKASKNTNISLGSFLNALNLENNNPGYVYNYNFDLNGSSKTNFKLNQDYFTNNYVKSFDFSDSYYSDLFKYDIDNDNNSSYIYSNNLSAKRLLQLMNIDITSPIFRGTLDLTGFPFLIGGSEREDFSKTSFQTLILPMNFCKTTDITLNNKLSEIKINAEKVFEADVAPYGIYKDDIKINPIQGQCIAYENEEQKAICDDAEYLFSKLDPIKNGAQYRSLDTFTLYPTEINIDYYDKDEYIGSETVDNTTKHPKTSLKKDFNGYSFYTIESYKLEKTTIDGTTTENFSYIYALQPKTVKVLVTFKPNKYTTNIKSVINGSINDNADISVKKIENYTVIDNSLPENIEINSMIKDGRELLNTKTGYIFRGYYEDDKCTKAITKLLTKSMNTPYETIYAYFEPQKYQISLDTDGGTIDKNIIEINYGDEVTLPECKKNGYKFQGWSLNGKDFNEKIYDYAENITLKAVYTKVQEPAPTNNPDVTPTSSPVPTATPDTQPGEKTKPSKKDTTRIDTDDKPSDSIEGDIPADELITEIEKSKKLTEAQKKAVIKIINDYTHEDGSIYLNEIASRIRDSKTLDDAAKSNASAVISNVKKNIKKTKIKNLKVKSPKKKQIKATWKKLKGYKFQVQVSTSKKFTKKTTKSYTTKKNSYTVKKKLKSKKTYYIRVRTVKKTKGGKNVYGKWSSKKKIKTK